MGISEGLVPAPTPLEPVTEPAHPAKPVAAGAKVAKGAHAVVADAVADAAKLMDHAFRHEFDLFSTNLF